MAGAEVVLAGGRRLHWAWRSDRGARESNEDRALGMASADGRTLVFAVADGLGGQGAGDVAAQAVIDAIAAAVSAEAGTAEPGAAEPGTGDLKTLIATLLARAHAALVAARTDSHGMQQADTTVVILAIQDGAVAWGNLGDSRLYRCNAGAVTPLSRDHSLAALLVETGALPPGSDVRGHPDRNRLVRTVASSPKASDIQGPVSLDAGSGFLLCSDGWWEPITEALIGQAFSSAPSVTQWLDTLAAAIRASADPDQDNYTAVAVMIKDDASRTAAC